MAETDRGPAPEDDEDGLPSIWQAPDADAAERRVRELERLAATLRASLEPSPQLEDVHSALAVARIDLSAHRAQRHAREQELALRRSEQVVRERREVVALFADTERRLLRRQASGDAVDRRLDAVRADLRLARDALERADAERRRLDGPAPG